MVCRMAVFRAPGPRHAAGWPRREGQGLKLIGSGRRISRSAGTPKLHHAENGGVASDA